MEPSKVMLQNGAQRDGTLESRVEQFGQKETIDVLVGLTSQIFVAVAASVIDDNVISLMKMGNRTVQRMLDLACRNIAEL